MGKRVWLMGNGVIRTEEDTQEDENNRGGSGVV